MRFTRLMIEANENTVFIDFHHRLTVVAGVDERVRAGLTDELIGGLGPDRTSLHLEVVEDSGRQLAVARPADGTHQVVELDTGADVSDEFRASGGRIDLLGHHGIEPRQATEGLRVDRSGLQPDLHRDAVITRLAEIDQTELWSCASRVRLTDDQLQTLADGIELSAEDSEMVALIEKRHQSLEAALEKHRGLRRRTAQVSIASLLAAVPVTLINPTMALPILAIGAATIVLTFLFRARAEAAQRSERSALADAGADSYLGFVVQRVDGLFSGTEQRRRLNAAADDHRHAAVRWTRLAGDVSVEWAFAHHDQISATAELGRHLRSISHLSPTSQELDQEGAGIAQALLAHLARLRSFGSGGESFPLILDDPFVDLPPSIRLTLLELLSRTADSPQIILLTDQDDVAGWARLEGLANKVGLVEPQTGFRDTDLQDSGLHATDHRSHLAV